MYLLIHTMTITECDFVVQAQFFHTFGVNSAQIHDARFVGRRLTFRMHPNLRTNRHKANLHRLNAPNLKTMMKRKSSHIKHHLRTIHIGSQNNSSQLPNHVSPKSENIGIVTPVRPARTTSNLPETTTQIDEPKYQADSILADFNPQQTTRWLTANRFDKYLQTFLSFSGSDMLRMSRDDLMQICGHADGIRLYNSLHSKTIAPKLTIYVCRENTTVFNAIFLSTHNNIELLQKLSGMIGVPKEQVRDIYMQGPQSIHIHLNNDVIKHIKEETMFNLEILQDNGSYVFLLKPAVK